MKGDIFMMGDQPTTCPICGARTDMINEIPATQEKWFQNHQCQARNCKFEFIVVEQ